MAEEVFWLFAMLEYIDEFSKPEKTSDFQMGS